MSEETFRFAIAVAFAVAFMLGFEGAVRMTLDYRRLGRLLPVVDRRIGFAIVVTSWLILVTVGWVGALTTFRLLGWPPQDWTPPITGALATAVALIPRFLWRVWDRVATRPDRF